MQPTAVGWLNNGSPAQNGWPSGVRGDSTLAPLRERFVRLSWREVLRVSADIALKHLNVKLTQWNSVLVKGDNHLQTVACRANYSL